MRVLFAMRMGVAVRLAFSQLTAFQHVHLGAGDAAAVHGFDTQTGIEVQRSRGRVQHLNWNTGVKQSAKKHVTGNPGKAIKISDTHGETRPSKRGATCSDAALGNPKQRCTEE